MENEANYNIANNKFVRHSALMSAYLSRDFEKFCQLIDEGHNIHCIDTFGMPLINSVIENIDNIKNNKDFFNKLLSSGVLSKNHSNKFDPLTFSIIRQDDIYYMKKILESGANVNIIGKSIEDSDIFSYGPPIFETLCKFDADKINLLLEYNPDLELCNADGQPILSFLFDICMHKDNFLCDFISILVKNGASLEDSDNTGDRPIHYWAKRIGDVKVLDFFIKNNVDFNVRNYFGETPLLLCIRNNHMDAAIALIKNGANLNVQNSEGQTAFMLAANCHELDLLNLMESKCDISKLDNDGENFAHYLVRYLLRSNYDNVDGSAKILQKHRKFFSLKNHFGDSALDILKWGNAKKHSLFINFNEQENML